METGVSSELLNDALDVLAAGSGLRKCDIAESLGVVGSTASAVVRDLLELNCISMGAVKYFRKDGAVTFKEGYFFEQDLPSGYRTPRWRQNRKESVT